MSEVLQDGESIEKAFFGNGPAYYDPNASEEDDGKGFYTNISGDYTVYVKTNKRVFSTKVELKYDSNGVETRAVADSTDIIYSESEIGNI